MPKSHPPSHSSSIVRSKIGALYVNITTSTALFKWSFCLCISRFGCQVIVSWSGGEIIQIPVPNYRGWGGILGL